MTLHSVIFVREIDTYTYAYRHTVCGSKIWNIFFLNLLGLISPIFEKKRDRSKFP